MVVVMVVVVVHLVFMVLSPSKHFEITLFMDVL